MAQASRQVRKLRRLRRELSLTRKLLDMVLKERNQARFVAGALEEELRKYDNDPFKNHDDAKDEYVVNEDPKPVDQKVGDEVV